MSYTVKPFRLEEHRGALARLWAENMSDARIASALDGRMRWLYEERPDGPARTVLALEAESGEVVGCGSFIPRPTFVDGRPTRAGLLCDFAVTRAHRIAGAALAIQRALVEAAQADGVEWLYGYPNEKSLAVFRRIGYRLVGAASTWAKPLRAGYKLREALRSPGAAAIAAAPVDLALRALDGARSVRTRPRLRAEPLSPSDGRTDALWDRARPSAGVAGVRSAAYLSWRYGGFTTAEHHVLGFFPRRTERLAAYAVYTIAGGRAFVRDLFGERLDEGSAGAVLLALAHHLRARGADSVSLSYVGAPAFGARLRRTGFLPRPGNRPLVVHADGLAEGPRARVLDPSSWLALDGELDI